VAHKTTTDGALKEIEYVTSSDSSLVPKPKTEASTRKLKVERPNREGNVCNKAIFNNNHALAGPGGTTTA